MVQGGEAYFCIPALEVSLRAVRLTGKPPCPLVGVCQVRGKANGFGLGHGCMRYMNERGRVREVWDASILWDAAHVRRQHRVGVHLAKSERRQIYYAQDEKNCSVQKKSVNVAFSQEGWGRGGRLMTG